MSLEALQCPTETSLCPNTSDEIGVRSPPSARSFVCMDWIATLLVRLDVKLEGRGFFTSHWFKLILQGTSNFPLKSILSLGTK